MARMEPHLCVHLVAERCGKSGISCVAAETCLDEYRCNRMTRLVRYWNGVIEIAEERALDEVDVRRLCAETIRQRPAMRARPAQQLPGVRQQRYRVDSRMS